MSNYRITADYSVCQLKELSLQRVGNLLAGLTTVNQFNLAAIKVSVFKAVNIRH